MTRIWILDTETTGTSHEEDALVEVGGVLLDDFVRTAVFETLVDPGRDVPVQASAIHHITAKHLVGAPQLEDATAAIVEAPANYYVAHNAKFDAGFLPMIKGPWICTYKCALRKWPDAPSHSNQVLRYYLGVNDPTSATHAHRALYDAEVTANIFCRMVEESKVSIDELLPMMVEISSKPALLRRVSFGLHKDKLWSELPKDYLRWILNKSSGWSDDQLFTARHYYDKV